MILKLKSGETDFNAKLKRLLQRKSELSETIDNEVRAILAAVRENGDTALYDFAKQFDGTDLRDSGLRVSNAEIESAVAELPEETGAALQLAAQRIADYHKQFLPTPLDYTDSQGIRLGARWRPMDSVGLYIPGGTAAYPSSLLMNAIPAQIAGVKRIAIATPAKDNAVSSVILAAAALLGIDEIYKIGGAHAIGAFAYGSESIVPVDKITGPGNAYVAAAKRLVFGEVGIDMIAGPSEILIVADAENNPIWLAADLLSQAEHDQSAQAILITDSPTLAEQVETHIKSLLKNLPREKIAAQAIRDYGAIIIVSDLHAETPAIIDYIAPEHLQIATQNADALMEKVSHAGAIFLGAWTPEAIGDYIAGPNHVLPTARTARFAQGLGVSDFLKRSSFIECSPQCFGKIGGAARHLAETEGLQAHALSLTMRLQSNTEKR